MSSEDSPRAQLKKIRDQLAVEAPRAKTFGSSQSDLAKRLQTAYELVSKTYLLGAQPNVSPDELEEASADALVEGHLALADWQRFVDEAAQRRQKTPAPSGSGIDRRQTERHDTGVAVRLVKHAVHGDGPAVMLETETAKRPARNVSLGGLFVSIGLGDLRSVGIGSVVHVVVSTTGASRTYDVRGVVTRRDEGGMALRWVAETAEERTVIEQLLTAAAPR